MILSLRGQRPRRRSDHRREAEPPSRQAIGVSLAENQGIRYQFRFRSGCPRKDTRSTTSLQARQHRRPATRRSRRIADRASRDRQETEGGLPDRRVQASKELEGRLQGIWTGRPSSLETKGQDPLRSSQPDGQFKGFASSASRSVPLADRLRKPPCPPGHRDFPPGWCRACGHRWPCR